MDYWWTALNHWNIGIWSGLPKAKGWLSSQSFQVGHHAVHHGSVFCAPGTVKQVKQFHKFLCLKLVDVLYPMHQNTMIPMIPWYSLKVVLWLYCGARGLEATHASRWCPQDPSGYVNLLETPVLLGFEVKSLSAMDEPDTSVFSTHRFHSFSGGPWFSVTFATRFTVFFLSKNHEKSAFHIHQGLEESCIKRLLLGVAFAANAGSVLLPISSTTTLITLSNWAVRAVSASMTLLCACCFLGKWTWSFDFDVSFGFVLFLHFAVVFAFQSWWYALWHGIFFPLCKVPVLSVWTASAVASNCKAYWGISTIDSPYGAGYSSLDLWHCSSLEILSNFSILSSSMALMALNFCPKRSDFFLHPVLIDWGWAPSFAGGA